MARGMGWLFIAGATIGLISLFLPRAPHTNVGALAVNIGLAYLGGKGYGGGSYGGGSYKPCRRSCQVKKCRSSCGKARRTCVFCAKQDGHERMKGCAALGSPAAVRSCKQQVKGEVRSVASACKGRTGGCNGCCGGDYSAACTDTFSGTRGFGDYFRTVRRYGKSHRYVPSCNAPSTGTGDDCAATCQREADLAARQCGKRGGADCLQGVQAALQQCLTSRCGVTTSTTSTLPRTGISTTSTLPPIVTPTTTIPFCNRVSGTVIVRNGWLSGLCRFCSTNRKSLWKTLTCS